MMAETPKTVEAVTPKKIIKASHIEVELEHTIPPVFLNISPAICAIKKDHKVNKRNCWRMWLTQQRKHRRRGELLRRLQLEKYESVLELDVGELQDLIDTANDGVAFVWPIGIPNIGAALELRNIWILEKKMEAKAAAAGA